MKPQVRRYGLDVARVEWQDSGPAASAYRDVYFSRDGGIAETGHVFLEGNHLPRRWPALPTGALFCIGETGFGTGLNFLCSWALWRQIKAPGARLHFVSCEQFPLTQQEMQRAHAAFPELAELAARLRAALPYRVRGQHRLHLAADITLDLLYGEATAAWSAYEGAMDAWFLDGFAPSRNPDMWSENLLAQVAAHSRAEATLATWSVAAMVRERLQRAGFQLQRLPGFGHKRHMLQGTYQAETNYPRRTRPGSACIIGSGLAGSALAGALARRAVQCRVFSAPGRVSASATPRAVLFARLSPFDNPHARLQISAYQHALRQHHPELDAGATARLQDCGVLQLADAATVDKWRLLCSSGGLPAEFATLLSPQDIHSRWGIEVQQGGLWFPDAGWISPQAYCQSLLAQADAEVHQARVTSIQSSDAGLCLLGADGNSIPDGSADTCIVAAGVDSNALIQPWSLPLNPVRGQYTQFPAPAALSTQEIVLCGRGYLLPAHNGQMACGASYAHNDMDHELRDSDHTQNLVNAAALSPAIEAGLAEVQSSPQTCNGHVAWRATLPGRLPAAGALGHGLHVLAGLGSRGLAFSGLCAELIAAKVCDEPWPVERELALALDPHRFKQEIENYSKQR